jgi:CheY-like chemotaxis protein
MLPFYHPSTVLFVDDDAMFLESCKALYGRQFPCSGNTSPSEAIVELRASSAAWDASLLRCLPQPMIPAEHDLHAGTQFLSVDHGRIIEISRQPERFATISVAIVDYAMPNMTGIEFFQAIRDLSVGKILLTGRAGANVAVEAFNCGLIDQFINKQDADVMQKLPAEIARLQHKFFSEAIKSVLPAHNGASEFFLDAVVCQHLEELSRKVNSVEHFLTVEPNGILFFNRSAEPLFVMVADNESLQAHLEVASCLHAPVQLLDQLSARSIMPVFRTETGYYEKALEHTWPAYTVPSKRLQGERESWWIAETRDVRHMPPAVAGPARL